MVKIRKGKLLRLGITALKKVPIIVGCLVFLFSCTSPFLHYYPWTFERYTIEAYCSFKVDIYVHTLEGGHISRQYWFIDYWFNPHYTSYLRIEPSLTWVLISMFIAQILTLIMGIASILSNREALASAPMGLCVTLLALMIYFNKELLGEVYWTEFEKGFWLTCLSLFVFLIAFITDLIIRRKQKINLKNITKTL